jgi:hypothetical protein
LLVEAPAVPLQAILLLLVVVEPVDLDRALAPQVGAVLMKVLSQLLLVLTTQLLLGLEEIAIQMRQGPKVQIALLALLLHPEVVVVRVQTLIIEMAVLVVVVATVVSVDLELQTKDLMVGNT